MLSLSLLVVYGASCLLCSALHVTKRMYLPEDYRQHFEEFIIKYNRTYASEDEKQMRFDIFKQNLEDINERNLNSVAVFGITFGTDLTQDEFASYYMGLKGSKEHSEALSEPDPLWKKAPASLDWREHNVVTEVKCQGHCGSCWTFSSIGNLEGQYAMKYKKLLNFSEQQLLDCNLKGQRACDGGFMTLAARYFVVNGAELLSDYPYTAKQGECQYNKSKVIVQPKGFADYTGQSEETLKEILYNVGPLSVGLAANAFKAYMGGILHDCSDPEISHGVLLVGYGIEKGVPYWIIKNSWGNDWGEKGYIRVKYGVNCCSLTSWMVVSVIL